MGKMKELLTTHDGEPLNEESLTGAIAVLTADKAGFNQGRKLDMATMLTTDANGQPLEMENDYATITDIAINRSWIWMQEYDPHSGQIKAKDQPWANEARRAFVDGFLEGFEAKFLGEKV